MLAGDLNMPLGEFSSLTIFCFFFSVRRRHTICGRDWSSDVCSSDLGFWRGVGVTHNTFVIESFMDELALAAKADPVEYRRALLAKSPRGRAVLELAAKQAGWGEKLPPGRGRGIALMYSGWDTYVAQVAEVSVSEAGEVRVHRVVCAVDCGTVVNPDIVN